MSKIYDNVKALLHELGDNVLLLLAVKGRSVEEVKEAISAGAKLFGENYLQEGEEKIKAIGHAVEWHFIGSIQKKKIKKIVELFDVIESVDSCETAAMIDRASLQLGKKMPVLIEVNSGREPQKSGAMPEDVEIIANQINTLPNVLFFGLMTMGPNVKNPEDLRKYFRETHELFAALNKKGMFHTDKPILSMGMSDSYKIAIEEGANLVRIGTLVFGPRK